MKLILIISFFCLNSFAITLETFNNRVEVFENKHCKLNNTCSLKEFSLHFNDYRIWVIDQWNLGTKIYAKYKTEKVSDLEDYVIVQFIRGCLFLSNKTDTGVTKYLGYVVDSFDETVTFKFPNWVIDSVDVDPMYWSTNQTEGIRHYSYAWNTVEDSFDQDTEKYFGIEKPTIPELYTEDLPGQSFVSELGSAVNLSLMFKTCIYKTKLVKPYNKRENIKLGKFFVVKPIHCFNWDSIFLYNHESYGFERKHQLDSFCLKK